MISSIQPHDRETLSALFDGELHGDASRFAHKRLAQDVQWRQACGTWQLAGDVLRCHATAAAPAGFADRVQLALANESAAAMAMTPATTIRSRRGWVGGAALAASVALAAWFVASPLDQAAPAVVPAPEVATMTPSRTTPLSDTASSSPRALAAGQAASREVAQRSRAQGPSTAGPGSRSPRAAVATAAPATPPAAPLAPTSTLTGSAAASSGMDATAMVDPFQLPPAQIATRPWPRSVLPHYPATGALTAAYGGRAQAVGAARADPPGFYPFEPRLPPGIDMATPSDAP